ncbi:hypothetical protein GFY24_27915 [Nocardia sp. SYP-A9097]|uniref:type 1 glutamine amidotransferase domain-containing protein n=1 Tax=Nocardia sp. SYP-A9097 TaxID=2663237 RepID=UPI00129AA514|nr:type 1 glutamine amidotransferase domain-containing protein [Nocardia sp. SYP-A9097]MRH91222.1 hypothetical protein [Nocardia sp. SYP-A9097]
MNTCYLTGGHGAMFDFGGTELAALTARFHDSGRIVSAVCHGPAALLNVTLAQGRPLLENRNVTGYSWPEEEAARREDAVPFDLQDALRKRGANYSHTAKPFQPYVAQYGSMIAGQNPASARPVAEAVVARRTT